MYKVYVTYNGVTTLMHNPAENSIDCALLAGTLTYDLGDAGKLEMDIPPHNKAYKKFVPFASIVYVEDDDQRIWCGRVISASPDYENVMKVTCEGVLNYLLDAVIRPYSAIESTTIIDALTKYIDEYNSYVDESKRFVIGSENWGDTISLDESSDYPSAKDAIVNNLVDIYGGYLKAESVYDSATHKWVNKIYYTEESGDNASQVVQFGSNLLDLTETIDGSELFTVLIPIGDDGLTIKSVNNDKDYIESADGIAAYGRIEKTMEFDGVTSASELKAAAEELLEEIFKPKITLELGAFDLRKFGVAEESIKIGEKVYVSSAPHGILTRLTCKTIELDLVDPANDKYTLGSEQLNLAEYQHSVAVRARRALVTDDIRITYVTSSQIIDMFN